MIGNYTHLSVARGTAVTTVSLDRDSRDVRIEVLRNLDSYPVLKSAFLQYIQATNVHRLGGPFRLLTFFGQHCRCTEDFDP